MPQLASLSTRAPQAFDKKETKEKTATLLAELDELQNRLYAQRRHALLVVLQGPDASGKDGAIRNVFGQLNPQGVQVQSFKVPTEEEQAHDFLWRIHRHAPAKGNIQIFNRSHYEDVLVTRVHGLIDDATAARRFEAINAFEQLLVQHNNTVVLKFFLHISQDEQQDRLNERLHDPTKQWKYNRNDFAEAARWEAYQAAYEAVFEQCNNPEWILVPADQNWYKEYLITKTVVEALTGLNMQYPGLEEKA